MVATSRIRKKRAKSVDQLLFNLDAKRFKAFNALLDAPVAANPGLERLMAIKPPWDDEPGKA